MNYSTLFLSARLLVVMAATAQAGSTDDLFSSVTPISTYESPVEIQAERGTIQRKLLSANQLRTQLVEVGMDVEMVNAQTVSTTKQVSPWSFPVMIQITDDEKHIEIILGLRSMKEKDQGLSSDELLGLMKLSRENTPDCFLYNAQNQRTELICSLPNQNLTGQKLRDEIARLAILAKDNADVWSRPQQSEQAPVTAPESTPQTQPETQPQTTPEKPVVPPAQTAELTGRWLASQSATAAFAIEFLGQNKFRMVFVNGTTQSKSEGTYTLSSNQLTLSGAEGLELKGKFERLNTNSFKFLTATGTELTFNRAQ